MFSFLIYVRLGQNLFSRARCLTHLLDRKPGMEIGGWVALGYLTQAVGLQTSDASVCAFLCSLTVVSASLHDRLIFGPLRVCKDDVNGSMYCKLIYISETSHWYGYRMLCHIVYINGGLCRRFPMPPLGTCWYVLLYQCITPPRSALFTPPTSSSLFVPVSPRVRYCFFVVHEQMAND